MQDLTPAARQRLDDIAARHGVSVDAAATLLRALAAGGGTMAQFSHPELGGMGQWSQGGMIMVGDMFNHGLKARVDALCTELAALLREGSPWQPAAGSPGAAGGGMVQSSGYSWWPAELGLPTTSGAQNDMAYAYFPAARRLAVRQGGQVRLYDTGDHSIYGVSQQQGPSQSLGFSSDRGTLRLEDLRPADAPQLQSPPSTFEPAPAPEVAPAMPPQAVQPQPMQPPAMPAAAPGGDPLAMIERLATLRSQGILTEEEFAAKKAELLARL